MQTGAHGLPSPLAHWRSCSVYGVGDGDQTSDTCLSPPSVLAVLAFGSTPLQIYPLLDNLSANLLMPYISERAPYILSIGPFNILGPKEGSESLCSLPITHPPEPSLELWRSTPWAQPCRVTAVFLLLIVLGTTIPILSISSQDILPQHVE